MGGGETAEDYEVENGVISEFLTLGGSVGYDLASWWRNTSGFAAWAPRDFLAVAPGSGGSLCIKLGDPDAGSVWWG